MRISDGSSDVCSSDLAGPVYQAGTLSGNPVAMAAGLAMLELIQAPGFHADLERRTNVLCDGLEAAAVEAGVALTTQRVGGMFGLFFSDEKVDTYAQAVACDAAAFNRFFHAMQLGRASCGERVCKSV